MQTAAAMEEQQVVSSNKKITLRHCLEAMKEEPTVAKAVLREYFRHADNIEIFGQFFFGHAMPSDSAEFHRELDDELAADKDSAVAAPRGHAKSTRTGGIFVPWCIVNDYYQFIVYISQSMEKTVQFVDPVRTEFKENDLLRWVYGDLTPKKVKDQRTGRDREDCFDVGRTRLQAVSFEKNLRGFRFGTLRPDLIICDDIEDDERVINPILRARDNQKFKRVIIGSLSTKPAGRIKVIGTLLNAECLLKDLIHIYDGKIYRAIKEPWASQVKDGALAIIDVPPHALLWPNHWSPALLAEKRRQQGAYNFQAEYMNDPVDTEYSIIKAEWIRASFDESLSFDEAVAAKYDHKYLGCDFAFSDRAHADKSAYIGLGVRPELYTLTSCIIKRGLSISQQFDYLEMISKQYGYNDVAMEENSIRSMSKELQQYSFSYTLFWTAATDAAAKLQPDPFFTGKRHTVGKLALLQRLATQFEQGRIKIPYKTESDKLLAHMILDECVTYAIQNGKLIEVGIHGDIPIGLALAVERNGLNTFAWDIGEVEF